MNEETNAKYPKLCATVEPIQADFPISYMVDSRFNCVHY